LSTGQSKFLDFLKGDMGMKASLKVGAAEVDITPPVGVGMVGGLEPRYSGKNLLNDLWKES